VLWDHLLVAEDDSERRIADLERRLAQPRAADGRDGSASERLTSEQVHLVAFSKPPLFKRGYNEDEVDAFLERVESTLRDRTAFGGLTAADLHNVAFSKPPLGKRGYNEDEVDAFVELVKIELSRR
jgi:DivIVA domain-containing protein